MTKDEMKDKISMALKDPILQMGFEVICSKLSRLEKENADLKEQVEQMKCCGNCQSVFDANGFCYLYKDGKCVDQSEWVKKEKNGVNYA